MSLAPGRCWPSANWRVRWCRASINVCSAASPHAQRFEPLAKRNDVIAQVFADPCTAGTTPREKAIVQFAIDLALHPDEVHGESLLALREQGLDNGEILDLIHAIAIFA